MTYDILMIFTYHHISPCTTLYHSVAVCTTPSPIVSSKPRKKKHKFLNAMSSEILQPPSTPEYPCIASCDKCNNLFDKICYNHRRCIQCSTPCRYGLSCTKVNCIFNHPPPPQYYLDYQSGTDGNESDASSVADTNVSVFYPGMKRSFHDEDNRNKRHRTSTSSYSSGTSCSSFSGSSGYTPTPKKTKTNKKPYSIDVARINYVSKEKLYVNVLFPPVILKRVPFSRKKNKESTI